MSQNRRTSRLPPKIHRRKNQEIAKEYFCVVTQCGKGYGSYAALYTHMKNKHTDIKPPNMPTGGKNKVTTQGRPKQKKVEEQKVPEEVQNVFCLICSKGECECVEDFDTEEKNKTIQIMGNEKFINLVNQIGQLVSTGDFIWVRRTEEAFQFKSPQTIMSQAQQFKNLHKVTFTVNPKLCQYLSFSSKYWDPSHIDELYCTIYTILAFENDNITIQFLKEHEREFPNMCACVEESPDVFRRLETLIRVI